MAGCKSCSGRSHLAEPRQPRAVEKLANCELSSNPRYPRIFVGKQAIYSDENTQLIVTVVSDESDEKQDRFILKLTTILKDLLENYSDGDQFQIDQIAGEHRWKLHALI